MLAIALSFAVAFVEPAALAAVERATPSPTVVGSCSGATFEQTDVNTLYSGSWTTVIDPGFSAQTATQGGVGLAATFYFRGSCVSWMYLSSPNNAKVSVWIDDLFVETLNTASSTTWGSTRLE